MQTHTLGFPRIGAHRELKKALEGYWKGKTSRAELLETAAELRRRHWQLQADAGVDVIPAGDFSLYDHVLDTTVLLGAIPPRYGFSGREIDLETYFAMARGQAGEGGQIAMEMTKWFDTNYHYIVPELRPGQSFRPASNKLLEEVREAGGRGHQTKAVLLGPLTWLFLGKELELDFDRWEHIEAITAAYENVLRPLSAECEWIQIDEPILVMDLPEEIRARFGWVYNRLKAAAGDARLMVATYFGGLGENLSTAVELPVDALHVDLVRAPEQLPDVLQALPDRMSLSCGVVNGRNIWKVEMDRAVEMIRTAADALGRHRVWVAPSCSLLHVPIDLEEETSLDAEVSEWMAFARQKCAELRTIADAAEGKDVAGAWEANREVWRKRRSSEHTTNEGVRQRAGSVNEQMLRRRSPFPQRKQAQQEQLNLPPLPTTTIGSFPQTREIRKARADYRKGRVDESTYLEAMRKIVRDNVERQETLGLD
ncbi:MAG: 5-methyltetrahydropteroyltriglutamate--homocysteine S-methyltransferase, partial [Planctomycetota bacterium]